MKLKSSFLDDISHNQGVAVECLRLWARGSASLCGHLRTQKIGICDITSISLFIDDVECLLQEEYGDVDSAALDKLLSALRTIVLNFTAYVRPDLSGEYYDAVNVDYINGIGVPKGYGLSSQIIIVLRSRLILLLLGP